MKILSIIDVITNSSTEVYVYQKNSDLFRELTEFLGPELTAQFESYDSLEDIWKEIESGRENIMEILWEQCRHGNSDWEGLAINPFGWEELGENMKKLIESGHRTKREVFDFFSPVYEEALGIALHTVPEGGFKDELAKKIDEFESIQREKNSIEVLKKMPFKNGDLCNFTVLEMYKEDFPRGFFAVINDTLEDFWIPDSENYTFGFDTESATGLVDLLSCRLATPEEVLEYQNAKTNYYENIKQNGRSN